MSSAPLPPGMKPAAEKPTVDEGTRVAMLVQLAGQAALMAEKTGDERIKRVAACAIAEVQATGALADILMMMASQPPAPSVNDVREQERATHQKEFYNALNERRAQTNRALKSLEMLLPQVIQSLCQPNPNSNSVPTS